MFSQITGNTNVPGPGAYYPSESQEPKCPMELVSNRLYPLFLVWFVIVGNK